MRRTKVPVPADGQQVLPPVQRRGPRFTRKGKISFPERLVQGDGGASGPKGGREGVQGGRGNPRQHPKRRQHEGFRSRERGSWGTLRPTAHLSGGKTGQAAGTLEGDGGEQIPLQPEDDGTSRPDADRHRERNHRSDADSSPQGGSHQV